MGFMDIGDGELSAVVQLDTSLVDMIRENESIIRSYMHCGGGKSLWDADIAWDYPAQVIGDQWDEDAAKLSHAIGFIAGVAAGFDVTPLELLDVIAHETKAAPRDITYRCVCSWVGGDPDRWRGKNTCPACLPHDKKRVEVYEDGSPELEHERIRAQLRAQRKPSQRRQKIRKVR